MLDHIVEAGRHLSCSVTDHCHSPFLHEPYEVFPYVVFFVIKEMRRCLGLKILSLIALLKSTFKVKHHHRAVYSRHLEGMKSITIVIYYYVSTRY